jgi:plastocyanin
MLDPARALATLLCGVCLAWGAPARGADITGSVIYSGTPPQRSKMPITIDQYICGQEKDADDLILGPKRGVQNAVVWLENPPAGAKWEAPLPKVEMDQKGCVFAPRMVVVPVGGTVEFLNSDRLLHNLHSVSKENPSFNRTQPRGRVVPITFTRHEIVAVTCDLHSWMKSWVVVAEHPFYAVTDATGGFRIANVPPGRYKLRMWQEALGATTRDIEVGPQGGAATFDVKALEPKARP